MYVYYEYNNNYLQCLISLDITFIYLTYQDTFNYGLAGKEKDEKLRIIFKIEFNKNMNEKMLYVQINFLFPRRQKFK